MSVCDLQLLFAYLNVFWIFAGTSGEGWFDPWQLLHSLKAKNIANKVRYCEGTVVNFVTEEKESYSSGGIERRKYITGVDVSRRNTI